MGNYLQKRGEKAPSLLDETHIFALWNINDVQELWNRFKNQIFGFAIVEAQFESIMSFKPAVAEHIALEKLFDILDNDHDGRLDGIQLLAGINICCTATFDEKAKLCFALFDFNLNATMSEKELVLMMLSSLRGLNMLTGGGEGFDPDLEVIESLATDCLQRCDKNSDKAISFEEFMAWARGNRELMSAMEALNKISQDAKNEVDDDDSAAEYDEDFLSDYMEYTDIAKESGGSIWSVDSTVTSLNTASQEVTPFKQCQWVSQCLEPTNYKMRRTHNDGPDTNMELLWVHGYRCNGTRNAVRFVLLPSESNKPESNSTRGIVFPSAALAVVYNMEKRTQQFYMGHSCEVTCIAVHPSRQIVATGDVNANIHVWRGDSLQCLSIIRGRVKEGIKLLCFSPLGDRIASVGSDTDNTLTVFDISSAAIISSAKGMISPAVVYDIAYSDNGSEIALVGKKGVVFFVGVNGNRRALESHSGRIGNRGYRQSFFCVTYFKEDVFVGCASGEIYRFRDHKCVEIVQAHGVREPVLTLFFNKDNGTVLSAGKDSRIKTWDFTLHEVGQTIDITEDVGHGVSCPMNGTIISLQQWGGDILVGTEGCDIFEIQLPANPTQHHTFNRIVSGHSSGELWGLAMHPTKEEFCTCGDDKMLRLWSIRSHEELAAKALPSISRAISYNNLGDILAVGMIDGYLAVIDAKNTDLRVCSSWKHSNGIITDIKFSPDGQYFAAASADTNIYIYKSEAKQAFSRQAVCKGHNGPVIHIDFSANSKFLQSNSSDFALMFWDIKGNQIKAASSLRDTLWGTLTCTLNWCVQGIWRDGSVGSEITACMAMPDLSDIVVCEGSKLLLFRYPSTNNNSLHQIYSGHSSKISSARFSFSKKYVVSIGGRDRTIILWRHDCELVDDSDDLAESSGSSSSAASDAEGNFFKSMTVPLGTTKSLTNDLSSDSTTATASKLSASFIADLNVNIQAPSVSSISSAVKPWKSAFVEPSWATAKIGSTDVDVELEWIHGYRSHDCRSNLLYSAAGSIVYNVAALAVVYNKVSAKQQFLHGAHENEVVSIAPHPTGLLFATGEKQSNPKIYIWSSKDMQVISRIHSRHEIGVSLLAFNTKGNNLASIGMDSNNTLCLYDWVRDVIIFRTPTDHNRVLCMTFLCNSDQLKSVQKNTVSEPDIICTGGFKHLKFWWTHGPNVKSQRALWGKKKKSTISCVASASPKICVSGSTNGTLLVWKDFKLFSDTREHNQASMYLHENHAIQSIWAIKGNIRAFSVDVSNNYEEDYDVSARYVVGDAGGNIGIWRMISSNTSIPGAESNYSLVLVKYFHLPLLVPTPLGTAVQSVCKRDNIILVGTSNSEIYEVNENSFIRFNGTLLKSSNDSSESSTSKQSASSKIRKPKVDSKCHNSGHSGEVWGLAMHPTELIFMTAGDDSLLKVWSLETNRLLSYIKLPDKARAIDINTSTVTDAASTKTQFCVVQNGGGVLIFDLDEFLYKDHSNKDPRTKKPIDTKVDLKDSVLVSARNASNNSKDLVAKLLSKNPTTWSQVAKYSFLGDLLAIGCHDTNIYLYDVLKNYEHLLTLSGHLSSVTHLDFGVMQKTFEKEDKVGDKVTSMQYMERYDKFSRQIIAMPIGQASESPTKIEESIEESTTRRNIDPRKDICLQSTDGSGNLLFWRLEGKEDNRIKSATVVKDVWWATFTCPYGWSIQGIWPISDAANAPALGVDYTAVARSNSFEKVPVLAAADNHGTLRIFNYPCASPGAADKSYKGHSQYINNINFSFNDGYCITVGGTDRSIFVWKTDIEEEIRERDTYYEFDNETSTALPQKSSISSANNVALIGDYYSLRKLGTVTPPVSFQQKKSWKGAISEPSHWKEPPNFGEIPDASLELRFVYGYRGWDCRNNIGFTDQRNEIVYHVGGTGIIFDTEKNSQIINSDHENEIICLSVHPAGHLVATGELGKNPKMVVWDARTGLSVREIQFHSNGISHIAFSRFGELLVSLGMDDDRTVAVHNSVSGSIVGRGKIGRGVEVFALSVGDRNTIITGGVDHVKFWELPKTLASDSELLSKYGLYTIRNAAVQRTIVSAAFLGEDAITGMIDGSIILWKNRASSRLILSAHTGAITYHKQQQLCFIRKNTYVGPITAMYAVSEINDKSIDSRELGPRVFSGGKDGFLHLWDSQFNKLWSLNLTESTPQPTLPEIQAVASRENKVLIGTRASEIYEVNILTNEVYRLMEGHFGQSAELRGLSTHPTLKQIATCADDQTVRIWDYKSRKQVSIANLEMKCRALCFNPDGSHLAVGTTTGQVIILTNDLLNIVSKSSLSSQWIQAICYSPDGESLAVGAYDSVVYLLETKSYSCKNNLKGHVSFVSAIDFSVDSMYMQTTGGSSAELLFWDIKSGQQIKSATQMRDVKWATSRCSLGWPVQGIHQNSSNGSSRQVTCVDRTSDFKFVVSGYDSHRLKLFRFPCPREGFKFKEYKGHADDVSNVQFSFDNNYVFSVGRQDKAILQFELVRHKAANENKK